MQKKIPKQLIQKAIYNIVSIEYEKTYKNRKKWKKKENFLKLKPLKKLNNCL